MTKARFLSLVDFATQAEVVVCRPVGRQEWCPELVLRCRASRGGKPFYVYVERSTRGLTEKVDRYTGWLREAGKCR